MKNTFVLLFVTIFLLSSCSEKLLPNFYKNKNDEKPFNTELSEIKLLVSQIGDHRKYESSETLKGNKKKIFYKGNLHCINPNGKYRNDFFHYLSLFGAKYIHASSAVRTVANKSYEYDYELKWSISHYEILQEFSKEAAKARNNQVYIGVAFGLIGASIAAATTDTYFRTPAKVKILFDSIELHDKQGNLVHKFTNIERVLEDDLIADADCECAFYNIDLQFKYFVKDLVSELENAILKDIEKL